MERRRLNDSNASNAIRVGAPTTSSQVLLTKAAEVLRLARKFPVGPQRNELRQMAAALRKLEERGFHAAVMDRDTAIQMLRSRKH
jgi:hypothetical protein